MASNESTGALSALKATLGYGSPAPGQLAGDLGSISATLRGVAGTAVARLGPLDLDETSLAPEEAPMLEPGRPTASVAARTTVLPRRKKSASAILPEERPRFDRVRLLGQGAMGAVELARDNDIRRTVAVKRVLPGTGSEAALLRFADEVRIVGQLEHPGIVPVYDVGQDPGGDIYLVMKHLQGETMEAVIDRLEGRDPEYVARFTLDQRVHIFLGVLDAIRYAHARGILHRDLKPANIMIGPFGEVTVLDWGIAKPISRPAATGGVEPLERTLLESHDQRLLETQLGSLAGTPLYMSPEQAAGRNDDLDERSDVFALSVMLFEWLLLEHPLKDKKTVTEVIAATISEDYVLGDFSKAAIAASVPMEYMYVIHRGVQRHRDQRFQSVAELEDALKRILDGRIAIKCHVTLA